MADQLSVEDLQPLRASIPDFDANPRYRYLAEMKLLPQQAGLESFESPDPITFLRRKVYGLTAKEKNLLKKQEQALIPFEQGELIKRKLQVQQELARAMAPTYEDVNKYGIGLKPPMLPAEMTAYGPGAPVPVEAQESPEPLRGIPQDMNPFVMEPTKYINKRNEIVKRGQLVAPPLDNQQYLEGPRPMAMGEAPNLKAQISPFEQQMVGEITEGRATLQDGQYTPMQLAKPRTDMMTPDEYKFGIDQLAASGLLPPGMTPETAPIPKGPIPRAEAQEFFKGLMAKDRKGMQVQDVATAQAQADFAALPAHEQTPQSAARIAQQVKAQTGILPSTEDILKGIKNPNEPLVKLDLKESASDMAQKEFMKSTRESYDKLKGAPALLNNIEAAKGLVAKAKGFMGPGGETLLEAAKFLNNRLGFSINTEGIKNAEELRSRIFFNIMENLKKVDAQPSQMQQLIMMDSLGKLGTDPQALIAMLDAYRDTIIDKIEAHNEEVDGAKDVKFPYDPHIKLPKREPGKAPVVELTKDEYEFAREQKAKGKSRAEVEEMIRQRRAGK